jgi:hypothetical protein
VRGLVESTALEICWRPFQSVSFYPDEYICIVKIAVVSHSISRRGRGFVTILVTNRSLDVRKRRLLLMGAKTCSRVAGVISALFHLARIFMGVGPHSGGPE